MTTRGEIISGAFEALGVADYTFDVTPEEQASAFRDLDDLMAEWEADGIDLGYTPAESDPNRSDVMTTPGYADAAIKRNLAIRLAPSYGKPIGGALGRSARMSYGIVRARTLVVPVLSAGRPVVRGGGNRWPY